MNKLILLIVASIFFIYASCSDVSAEIITNKKLITVDIGKQTVFAWDNGQIVYQTIASTGMRYTPTVKGSFTIRRKVPV